MRKSTYSCSPYGKMRDRIEEQRKAERNKNNKDGYLFLARSSK